MKKHLNSSARSMEKKEQEQEQWQGAMEARLSSTPAAAVWVHVADFFALHWYLPSIDVCEREAGDGDEVLLGCVWYCASFKPGTEEVAAWAREELVELHAGGHHLAYTIVDSNIGLGHYIASMTVLPAADADRDDREGCRLVWAFECEPVQGWTKDGLLGYLYGGVKGIAARIEEAVAAAASAVPAPATGGRGAVVP